MSSLADKVILVTGATAGIGREVSESLARLGAKVVLSGRRKEEGDQVVAAIRGAGGEATFIESSVNDEQAVKDLVAKVLSTYGRLDGAVNNAGISTDDKPFHLLSTEKFEDMIKTNILGVFWCMQAEIAAMLENKGGAIVNLASMAGLNGLPYCGSYAATKHAVVGMTKTAALDYGTQGIRVNAVAPGAIRTNILEYATNSGSYPAEKIEGMFPMKRMGRPKEIAEGVIFLLHAEYCTGETLSIDGGFNAA